MDQDCTVPTQGSVLPPKQVNFSYSFKNTVSFSFSFFKGNYEMQKEGKNKSCGDLSGHDKNNPPMLGSNIVCKLSDAVVMRLFPLHLY